MNDLSQGHGMRILSIAIWIVAILIGTFVESEAQVIDPCPRPADTNPIDAPGFLWPWNWGQEDAEQTADAPQVSRGFGSNDAYFTTRPGRFVNVTCDAAEYEEQEMYPIGLVVRPIGVLDLPTFEASKGSRAVLVVTEYGLRKILPETHLQRIAPNATYVFADTPVNSRICRKEDNCPGNSAEGPHECVRPRQCRYEIASRYGYAVTATSTARQRAVIAAYRTVLEQSDPTGARYPGYPDGQRLAQMIETACRPIRVRAYGAGGKLKQPRDSFLSFCAQRRAAGAAQNAVGRLKLVDIAYAERAFFWSMDGSFHRRLGSTPGGGSEILTALGDYQFTDSKDCNKTITTETETSVSAGIKASVSAGIVDISAGAEATGAVKITTTLGDDDYLMMSTYLFSAPGKEISSTTQRQAAQVQDAADPFWFSRILFRSQCENSKPALPTSIQFYFHRFAGGMMEIGAYEDLQASYTQDWGNFSLSPEKKASYLREGQFWKVMDLPGYFLWRETLRQYVEVDNNISSQMLAKLPPQQRPFVRDFFVFLIFSSAYFHRDPGG